MSFRVAVASYDGKSVDRDFVGTDQFFVFELSDNRLQFLENRRISIPCQGHRKSQLIKIIEIIDDCEIVIASEICPGAAMLLGNKGIQYFAIENKLEDALSRILWIHKKRRFFEKKKNSKCHRNCNNIYGTKELRFD